MRSASNWPATARISPHADAHMRHASRYCFAALVILLAACSTSVPGHGVRASGEAATSATAKPLIPARDLLLQDGNDTPIGPATATAIGDNYFTRADPPECNAALLFEGSPLRPPNPTDYAESSYTFGNDASYAESVGTYDHPLNTHDVVLNAFTAVSGCHGDVTGVSPQGRFGPMRLSYFATSAEGVLVWTMSRPDWNCDYGLAVVARAALLMSVCQSATGFPMADWAAKRRAQLDSRA